MSSTQPLIETVDLVKKFGAFTALNGVSLKVYPGEVHALLGDNGAEIHPYQDSVRRVPATEGQIRVEGEQVNFALSAQRHGCRYRHGLPGSGP